MSSFNLYIVSYDVVNPMYNFCCCKYRVTIDYHIMHMASLILMYRNQLFVCISVDNTVTVFQECLLVNTLTI